MARWSLDSAGGPFLKAAIVSGLNVLVARQHAARELQRPKCGGYRTARSRVRVVVRRPGQQRGRAGCFRGSPQSP
jgi:hypothetical protein